MEKIPVGIYNGELFMVEEDKRKRIDGIYIFDVIRPVSKEHLEAMHEPSEVKEQIRDIWQCLVQDGKTELGLNEFVEQAMSEEDDGDERFVGKDDSFCDIFDYNEKLRDFCDKYINFTQDIEVGTWEASGCFKPEGHFDLVFNKEIAEEFYEQLKEKTSA